MVDPALLFIDVEAEYAAVIERHVRVRAATMVPKTMPDEFVRVIRIGGTSDVITDNPVVTFFVWGPSWPKAHSLAQLVRQRVMSTLDLGDVAVYRVAEVQGLQRAPDGPDGSPCYQFTIETKLRGKKSPFREEDEE